FRAHLDYGHGARGSRRGPAESAEKGIYHQARRHGHGSRADDRAAHRSGRTWRLSHVRERVGTGRHVPPEDSAEGEEKRSGVVAENRKPVIVLVDDEEMILTSIR